MNHTATEIAERIDQLIPDDVHENYMKNYAGLTSSEMRKKWLETPAAKEYFEEDRRHSDPISPLNVI